MNNLPWQRTAATTTDNTYWSCYIEDIGQSIICKVYGNSKEEAEGRADSIIQAIHKTNGLT